MARFVVTLGYSKNERACTLMAKFHGLHRVLVAAFIQLPLGALVYCFKGLGKTGGPLILKQNRLDTINLAVQTESLGGHVRFDRAQTQFQSVVDFSAFIA